MNFAFKDLRSTASQGTSNIPFAWFLLLECNRQARTLLSFLFYLLLFWFSGDIILFPDEYNSILIRTEINVPEIPKMNADNK